MENKGCDHAHVYLFRCNRADRADQTDKSDQEHKVNHPHNRRYDQVCTAVIPAVHVHTGGEGPDQEKNQIDQRNAGHQEHKKIVRHFEGGGVFNCGSTLRGNRIGGGAGVEIITAFAAEDRVGRDFLSADRAHLCRGSFLGGFGRGIHKVGLVVHCLAPYV